MVYLSGHLEINMSVNFRTKLLSAAGFIGLMEAQNGRIFLKVNGFTNNQNKNSKSITISSR